MNLQEKNKPKKPHSLSIFPSHLNTDLLSDAPSAPVWLQCIPIKGFFLGKDMVSSSAVEMRRSMTPFSTIQGEKQKRHKSDSSDRGHKVLKIAANKRMNEKLRADGWFAV